MLRVRERHRRRASCCLLRSCIRDARALSWIWTLCGHRLIRPGRERQPLRATVFSLKIAKLSDEIGIEVTAGIADTMDSPRPAWLVFGNERLGIIDAHREIKNGVVRKSVAPSGGEVALEDVVTGKARRALTRDKAQEQAAT